MASDRSLIVEVQIQVDEGEGLVDGARDFIVYASLGSH